MTNALWPLRAAHVEAALGAVIACCLLVQLGSSDRIGLAVALPWGLLSALAVSEFVASQRRLWQVLALANLALSTATTDSTTLAAIWLPGLTALVLRWRERSMVSSTVPVEDAPDVATPDAVAVRPLQTATDPARQHGIEWSQLHDHAGLVRVEGIARVVFRPGERQTELHLAFCPSFPASPTFECLQSSGPDVRLKIGQCFPYGVRLEVQRADAAAWSVVGIEFTASREQTSAARGTKRNVA